MAKQCCPPKTQPKIVSLTDLVNDYIANVRPTRDCRGTAFLLNPSSGLSSQLLKEADVVNLCTYGLHFDARTGKLVKMEKHQCRIAHFLPLIEKELKRCSVLSRKFKDYEEAYDYVHSIVASVRKKHPDLRFGPTATYDVAARLFKAICDGLPKDYVYFHSGALIGIKNLYANLRMKRPPKAIAKWQHYTIKYADLVSVPKLQPLARLRADEIEDLCCIKADELLKVKL